jgi:hypothetical protein
MQINRLPYVFVAGLIGLAGCIDESSPNMADAADATSQDGAGTVGTDASGATDANSMAGMDM